ncbi:MAG: DUF5060 domain-containing protein [Sedimentisphaerales bacterium]|nr:DUF5060 domain-containing protein [Sedimentisphaerales bacterium]
MDRMHYILKLFMGLAIPVFAESAPPQWGIFETMLKGPANGCPYLDVTISARFVKDDQAIEVPGFWDGGDVYKIRFMPTQQGVWRYETRSNRTELDGHRGSFTAVAPSADNHGPVQVFDTYYLRYADGTPYHQFGTTCYAWVHQNRTLQEQTLRTLAESPFNKIRFCVFPKAYVYNQNEPEFFAFSRGPDGRFDFHRPDPDFWRHFEKRLLDLQKLGIEADIILWHPYDRWGFADMSDEEDDLYLRYCIARLSAFRNVWWSLANEYDFMTERPKGHRGNKQWEDWDRFFAILQKEDPHQRLRGIHNGSRWYDHTKDWVTHASLQTSDMNGGVRFRRTYRKPILYDECKYEGDIPQGWGNLTAQEMVQRFWLGTLSGCYVGHGETYKHPQDILWWAKGGVLHGQSPQRIQWLKDLMAQAPPFHTLQPLGNDQGQFLLARPGEYYLLYCLSTKSETITLDGDRPYKVDSIDPWSMTVTPIGTAPPGVFHVAPLKSDMAFRFVPYQPGEKRRPQAILKVSVTEGLVPLTVTFTGAGGIQTCWDFGDGQSSDAPNPTHVFQKPGVYPVKLTVRDADGESAQAFVSVAVDWDVKKPIARIGFLNEEIPSLQFHGAARRLPSGSLQFPSAAPWGWVQAGEGILDDLRSLRSFTIMGWLMPESLVVGSGGNRILFCLKKDRSGIDLVCLADGRMRLAVNQWPDAVRNDSSAGKLQIGKWTFFAVTYDGTKSQDNVCWYFSRPMDAPQRADLMLDRRNSYPAGAVAADIGPLAVGNFNQTMQDYGLDRQFRGMIHGLSIFGSRTSGRGALDLDAIRKNMP